MDWKTFALHEGHEKDDNFQLANFVAPLPKLCCLSE